MGGDMSRIARVLSLGAVACLAAPRAASADKGGNIGIDIFRPAMDSRGYLTINASQVLGSVELSFGLGALDWGHHILQLGDPATCDAAAGQPCYQINNVLTATLIAAFGVHLGPIELEFGGSLPLTIMDGDRGPDQNTGDADPNNDQLFGLDGQGVGSIGLHLKTRFLKTS